MFKRRPDIKMCPLHVLLVWPAISRSVEAYCYHAFLSKLSEAQMRAGKLGGWTQTSSAVSPLGFLLQAEASRMMRSQCLNCGGKDHFANRCPRSLVGAPYPCECGKSILVTARGQTVLQSQSSSSSSSTSSNALAAAATLAGPSPSQRQSRKRTATTMAAVVAEPSRGGATPPR